jgi:hypothetical protein
MLVAAVVAGSDAVVVGSDAAVVAAVVAGSADAVILPKDIRTRKARNNAHRVKDVCLRIFWSGSFPALAKFQLQVPQVST